MIMTDDCMRCMDMESRAIEFYPLRKGKHILLFDNHSTTDQKLFNKVAQEKENVSKAVKSELHRSDCRVCSRCGLSLVEHSPFFEKWDIYGRELIRRYYIYNQCPLCGSKEYKKVYGDKREDEQNLFD